MEGVQHSAGRLDFRTLVPSVPELESHEIKIDPLHPSIVRLVTAPEQNMSDNAKSIRNLFSFNHIQSLLNRFVKNSKSSKNAFDAVNSLLVGALNTPNAFVTDASTSNAALAYATKLYATALGNIYSDNILEKQTRRLLKKLLLHQFAPKRTARHLNYRKKRKAERPTSSKAPFALLKLKRKNAASAAVKRELAGNLDSVYWTNRTLVAVNSTDFKLTLGVGEQSFAGG